MYLSGSLLLPCRDPDVPVRGIAVLTECCGSNCSAPCSQTTDHRTAFQASKNPSLLATIDVRRSSRLLKGRKPLGRAGVLPPQTRSAHSEMTQFVVVGAGPAGCSAALKAARIPDVQVKVIEKRSFQSVFEARNNPRSYPMVLSGRALGLFEELDLDLPSTREPYHGIEFLPSKGSLKFPSARRCRNAPFGTWFRDSSSHHHAPFRHLHRLSCRNCNRAYARPVGTHVAVEGWSVSAA